MPKSMIHLALLALAATLLTGAAAGSMAQDNAAQWVHDLSSDDFTARKQAMHALLADNTLTVGKITAMYALTETEEQRQRLLTVARHHVIREIVDATQGGLDQAGAVGITTNAMTPDQVGALNVPAIHVSRRFPGFPAFAALQKDDLITHVNGQALPQSDDADFIGSGFGSMVKSHPAGTVIQLRLVRDGKTMEVPVKLAHYEALRGIYPFGSAADTVEEVEEAWQDAKQRILNRSPHVDDPIKIDWDTPPR